VSGTAFLSTIENGFDTVLTLRRATVTCRASTELVCNDDSGAGGDSFLSTRVEAGQTYLVVVDGHGGQGGAFHLRVSAPLAREQCSATCKSYCRQVQCPRRKKNRQRCIRRCTKRAMPTCADEGQCF
jgi:hypothetical protein